MNLQLMQSCLRTRTQEGSTEVTLELRLEEGASLTTLLQGGLGIAISLVR